MRIIDKYICKEVFSHALVGLLIFTFVLFVPKLITLMTIVVRHSAPASRLGLLFLCVFPYVLTFTLPMAVLVGVLIGLGRMSADSELIALSALGVGLRRVLVPVGVLATFTALVTLTITLWVGPAAQRKFREISDQLTSAQASYEVQPRVFQEYPGMVLYIQNIDITATHWSGVFLAQQSDKSTELTLAENAIVVADREQAKLDLHLNNGSVHGSTPNDPTHYWVQTFGKSELPVEFSGLKPESKSTPTPTERTISDLMATTGKGSYEARVEIQRRFAFPVACMVFALLAVPLAARPRRGGRAMGFIVSLLLVCGYYLMFIVGAALAKDGKVSPVLGIWAANFITGLAGLALLPGMEQIRSSTRLSRWFERVSDRFKGWYEALRGGRRGQESSAKLSTVPTVSLGAGGGKHVHGADGTAEPKARVIRLRPVRPARMRVRHSSGFPQMLDLYLLKNFCGFFLLVMVGFVFLFEIFTFFELLDNIAKNHTPFLVVVNYFRFLVPFLFYHLAPFAVLVAAMVTLGVMSKNNEVVAIKAGGVSLYRLAWPIIGTGAVLAAGLLVLSNTYLPYFNQRQDALLNQIKGKPAQTYLRPNRSWIQGASTGTPNRKFYNYAVFDPESKPVLFGGLNVFEVDPATFQLRRRIHATRAEWSPELNVWVLKDGWVRDFDAGNESASHYSQFTVYSAAELDEPPSHFNREVRQSDEMSWRELQNYIGELKQSGFDVGRLSVQWHEKLAFPMIAPIIAFLSIPFAFYVGTRGAVGGLALGIGIGIVYWATSALFEALGGVGQMPPLLAGWAPDAIFIFLGTYFFLKMPT
jgi:LPS export ABC transporter permease LptF/LPS export ABC transporter permease LptG